jgi:hypothetical protein
MPLLHADEPIAECASMAEQPVAWARPIPIGAGTGIDVVVEFEVSDAEVGDERVDRGVQVFPGGRMPEVEVIAVMLA